MNLIILASLIIFCMILSASIKNQNRKREQAEQSFWKREREANSVRRKSLDNMDYITIPLDLLPTHVLSDNSAVAECLETLSALSALRIVNLTGYSNTDLKLEYGTANITDLSEYDQNYTLLVRTLQKWADILLEEGYSAEAQTVMEFAIRTHTDISRTYYKLAEIYVSRKEPERVRSLIETAESLRSANKNTIVHKLRESYL